jgi:hypothetical protein
MKVEFLDMQEKNNPLNGILIDSGRELMRILEQLRHREPFGLELVGENGFRLTICLAESRGAVQHDATCGDSPYLLAVAPGSLPFPPSGAISPHTLAARADAAKGVESPEFLIGGTVTPIPTRYCLPYEFVRDIAVYFLQTGDREPRVIWESI